MEINHYIEEISNKLSNIINYINEKDKLPDNIDNGEYFQNSKNKNIMIYTPIRYNTIRDRNEDYSSIQYYKIKPVIDLFFSLSNEIRNREIRFRNKYNLKYEKTIVVNLDNRFITLNDYIIEIFYNKILSLLSINEDLNVMVYTRCNIMFDFLKKYNINNSRITIVEIFQGVENTLSMILFMSKCKYIITYSGLIPIWIMYYRNGCDNVYQYLNNKWLYN